MPLESASSESDLVGRQLEVLRSTYPAWKICFRHDEPGTARWTAVLRRPITAQMTAAGLRQRIDGPDAITLAGALAHQAALLHTRRAGAWPA
ncbi:hypothetical protein SAMN05444920_113135 [Nonomuraea solani]|uniref:Uncharacterized protein n=1 Tax=Nonomuraea solani TaxID=1144553 RepID=A0A1H6ERU3_9ACTN|nr:hypothetical protein [Nonomuraea solani]SEG99539.1 hypothetical protein SAMN05444920_113135 [Nonomuraea solani]